jgi:hypothetical protein
VTESARVSAKVRICQLSCVDRVKHFLGMKPGKRIVKSAGEIIGMRMCKGVAASLVNIADFLGYVMNSDEVLKMLSLAG